MRHVTLTCKWSDGMGWRDGGAGLVIPGRHRARRGDEHSDQVESNSVTVEGAAIVAAILCRYAEQSGREEWTSAVR